MVDIRLKFQQKTNKNIFCWNNQNLIIKSGFADSCWSVWSVTLGFLWNCICCFHLNFHCGSVNTLCYKDTNALRLFKAGILSNAPLSNIKCAAAVSRLVV